MKVPALVSPALCQLTALPASSFFPEHTDVLYVRASSVSRVYGRESKRGVECVPASGGHIPVKRGQLALCFARKLRSTHTLKPILRKLRSVLISVDMAALYVSSVVSTSRVRSN